MDQDACFRQFINAVCDDDRDAASDSLLALRYWMERGGDLPKFPDAKVPALFIHNLANYMRTQ